jgi:glutaredoxin
MKNRSRRNKGSRKKSLRKSRARRSLRKSRKKSIKRSIRKSRKKSIRKSRRKSRRRRSKGVGISVKKEQGSKEQGSKEQCSINIKLTVNNKINGPLTIYTLDGCGACQKAKDLLKEKGIKFTVYPKKDHEETIKKLTNGYKYAPVIIDKNNKFIGGFEDIRKILM